MTNLEYFEYWATGILSILIQRSHIKSLGVRYRLFAKVILMAPPQILVTLTAYFPVIVRYLLNDVCMTPCKHNHLVLQFDIS